MMQAAAPTLSVNSPRDSRPTDAGGVGFSLGMGMGLKMDMGSDKDMGASMSVGQQPMTMSPSRREAVTMRSTAGRLRYADPQSLPSFPSYGLSSGGAAASAAATLGWSASTRSQKALEAWKPEKTSSASTAALFAKDYKMPPSWEPASNGAGAKAALLAVGSAGVAIKKSTNQDNKTLQENWGNSAATQAFHATRPSSARPHSRSDVSSAATQAFNMSRSQSVHKLETPTKSPQGMGSLAAAKGAMSSSVKSTSGHSSPKKITGHRKAHSTDATNASASALNGATVAHRAATNPASITETGAVSVTTMTRNMFTSHPPVKPEVDEKTNNERIHQSAVDMAKKMYQQQQRREALSWEQNGSPTMTTPYFNLQDAAYKQAQERLAKLHDDHTQTREWQEYYGKEAVPRRRFSVISKLRRRSLSDDDIDDQERSEKIRQQMSLFSSQLSQVDKEKRDKDREVLLAAAQRNVKARLQDMDEKASHGARKGNFKKEGDWETKTQHAAQTLLNKRTRDRTGVDIGGGRFMKPEEIDAIAAARVQPILDDINEKAEKERERLAAIRLEEEAKMAETDREKIRERELKEISKKAREEDKQLEKNKRLLEKQGEKARREEEKAAKATQKRLAKDEKRKGKDDPATSTQQSPTTPDFTETLNEPHEDGSVARKTNRASVQSALDFNQDAGDASSQRKVSDTSVSPTSKVKSWLKTRFSRGKSFGEQIDRQPGFIGGAALREHTMNGSTASFDNSFSSMRDVALAGKIRTSSVGNVDGISKRDSHGVSPVSSLSEADNASTRSLEPPKPLTENIPSTSSSPMRDSRFKELMDR